MTRLGTLTFVALLALTPVCAWSADTALARRHPASAEPLAGLETDFGALQVAPDLRLRTFTTRPAGSRGRLPAVYFVQWLSCDSVEIGRGQDGWTAMLRMLVQDSGMVVARLDKAGVGDSEGGPCGQLDYDTEVAHHRLGLRALLESDWVDPERVFVFGASMGANIAPLLADLHPLRGIAVWGGGAQSWFERQLGFERRALELGGAAGAEIDERMRRLSRAYSALLLQPASAAAFASDPQLAADWNLATGAGPDSQFGRPLAFHRQAQARHWAAAWERVEAPVLALFGEYDWYEDAAGVELIGAIINRRVAGRARTHIVAGIDHHFTRYVSAQAAYAGTNGSPDAAAVMDILLPWLAQHAQ